MKTLSLATAGALLASGVLVATTVTRASAPRPSEPTTVSPLSAESTTALIEDYCLTCHNDAAKTGNLSLESFDAAHPENDAATAEKMIRKLRTGMMPPSFAMRPEPEEVDALASTLETAVDTVYFASPDPGTRIFQRLNRAEYHRAVRDLLAIDVDVEAFLPPDTMSHGFDNVADVQTMSATLLEGYMRAAAQISRDAVGDPSAVPSEATYKIPRTANQMNHIEGAPMGTRGGISVVHNFPADGEYVFRMQFHASPTGQLYGGTETGEKIEISVNGQRAALMDVRRTMDEVDPDGMNLQSEPISINAGPQRISAAFLQRAAGPVDDLLAPIEHTLADTTIGTEFGITALPHLREFAIKGPYRATGVSETPSRHEIFTCRPTTAEEERPCAEEIVKRLASRAYRRPLTDNDVEGLMSFYETGAAEGDFETGIRTAIQAILASPFFVLRLETVPRSVDGAEAESYRLADLDLASRLSFFLWGSVPDEELIQVAAAGKLSEPEELDRQVERMLKDSRSEALATRFASQWLRLQDLSKIHPDYQFYPHFDHTLAESMQRETELFFDYILKEDRPVPELLTADYTFVNERLAEHYGIPNVTGDRFRRVQLEGEERRGILGHGSILMLTSIADRTSPVQRGKWIMEVLLGSPPPPPPPNVPALEETSESEEGKMLSVREAMEMHRANPACQSCHRVIDPLGLALENFDVTGMWRIRDNGVLVDATGELYDGQTLDGPAGLRQALLSYQDAFIRTFTESLMTYALGRRVEYNDMPVIRKIARTAAEHDNRVSYFIKGVVGSAAFQMKNVVDDTETTQGE